MVQGGWGAVLVMSGVLLVAGCATWSANGPRPPKQVRVHRTPKAPTNLSLTRHADHAITVRWRDASSNEDAFAIERRAPGGPTRVIPIPRSEYGEARTGDTLTFTDSGLQRDTPYCYRVKAYNESGEAWSSERCARLSGKRLVDHRDH